MIKKYAEKSVTVEAVQVKEENIEYIKLLFGDTGYIIYLLWR